MSVEIKNPHVGVANTFAAVTLESVLITDELDRRIPRPAEYAAENQALTLLMQALSQSAAESVLQQFVDTMLRLCRAHSAGISLLRERNGEHVFVCPAVAGPWSRFLGGSLPRDFSPCGVVLDRNTPLLMAYPERHFSYTEGAPPIAEALLVPFYVDRIAVGTVWLVAHDESRKFDSEDRRLLTNLSQFAATAYRVLQTQERAARSNTDLTDELAAIRRLQEISRYLVGDDVDSLYNHIVEAATDVMRSDMASLQIFNQERNVLQLTAHKGFAVASAAFWESVDATSGTACGRALRVASRVVVENIETCDFVVDASDLEPFRASGIRAVQSTPLLSRSGEALGILSTHWCKPHLPSDRDLRRFDVLARQTADLIERTSTSARLRASEVRATRVLESITDLLQVYDADWRLTYMNGASRAAVLAQGLDPNQMLGKNLWTDLFPDTRGTALEREYRRAMTDRVPVTLEHFYRAWQRWFSVRVYPMEEGGVAVYFQDITERKRAEQALADGVRQKESLFRLADGLHRAKSLEDVHRATLRAIVSGLQCDRAATLLFDPTGAMRFVDWLGLSEGYRHAVEGHSPWPADTKDPRPICIDDIETAGLDDALATTVRNEGIRALAFIPLALNGKLIGKFMAYFDTPHTFTEEEIELATTIARQLSFGIDRKRTEDLMRANARQLALITDAAPVFIAYCDAQARFKFVNKAYTERFGLNPEDCIGRHISEIVGESAYSSFRQYVETVLRGKRIAFETTIPYAIGERFMHGSYAPEFDANGNVVGFVAAITDITERKQIEQALRHSEEQLKEADRRKDEFLATLAHELRNPLAPLLHGVNILKAEQREPEITRHLHAMMERQLGHMVRMVDDLLDVSRISRGKFELRKERADITVIVRQAIETTRPLIETGQHAFTQELPAQPIFVDGDVARLAQIVGNLLNNAGKFTPAGGRIHIAVTIEATHAVVRVRDSGIGIAADHIARIFEMFTQVDTSLERAQNGLGIGLTLVKTLTEMHGGTVEAISEGVGHGSEFVVRLPLATERQAPPAKAALSEPPAKNSLRILVVDDNADSADSLATLLDLTGHTSRIARDGVEALQLAASFIPHLILLDIGLPKLNGYEVARRIRQQPWGTNIKLIALTGWGQDNDRKKSKEAGFDDHMVKPADYATLLKIFDDLADPANAREDC